MISEAAWRAWLWSETQRANLMLLIPCSSVGKRNGPVSSALGPVPPLPLPNKFKNFMHFDNRGLLCLLASLLTCLWPWLCLDLP